jgi:hypothetical protein
MTYGNENVSPGPVPRLWTPISAAPERGTTERGSNGGWAEGKTMTFTVMVDVVGVQADSPDDAIQKVAAVLLEHHWDIDFYATIQTDN